MDATTSASGIERRLLLVEHLLVGTAKTVDRLVVAVDKLSESHLKIEADLESFSREEKEIRREQQQQQQRRPQTSDTNNSSVRDAYPANPALDSNNANDNNALPSPDAPAQNDEVESLAQKLCQGEAGRNKAKSISISPPVEASVAWHALPKGKDVKRNNRLRTVV